MKREKRNRFPVFLSFRGFVKVSSFFSRFFTRKQATTATTALLATRHRGPATYLSVSEASNRYLGGPSIKSPLFSPWMPASGCPPGTCIIKLQRTGCSRAASSFLCTALSLPDQVHVPYKVVPVYSWSTAVVIFLQYYQLYIRYIYIYSSIL